MNHQPFEEWLLNDKHLAPAEQRELDSHLRTCVHCTALSATGLALRSARAFLPAPGFVARFETRLAAHHIAERRRKLWGLFALIFTGVGFFAWSGAPYIYSFLSAPVEWVSALIGFMLFVFTSIQAFAEALAVIARVAPGFLPPYAWMVFVSALAGVGLLWTISIWRFARAPQGVSV